MKTTQMPRYAEMTPESLRSSYREWRASLWNASQMRRAAGVFNCQRHIDAICDVAHRRGIALLGNT